MKRLLNTSAAVALLAAAITGRADDPESWSFDLSTTGNDVFWTSPTSVDPDADRYDVTRNITLVEVTVRYLIFDFTLDVTDQVPPEYLMGSDSVAGPAPITLFDQMIVYPDPPEPPGVAGDLFIGLDSSGFGQASFTNVTLGQVTVALPGFGTVTATVRRIRLAGSLQVKAVTFVLGDMNCDGIVTPGDIAGFVLALTNPNEYAVQFPACSVNNADINDDGVVTPGDIAGFVALLTGG